MNGLDLGDPKALSLDKINLIKMKRHTDIIDYIEKNPFLTNEQLESAIQELGSFKEKEIVSFLCKMVDNDKYDWEVKNAIALTLGDIGLDEAVPCLMKIVLDPRNNGYSGTFLYSLTIKPLQCKEYFLEFIELLCTGNLEIRESAIILIEEFHDQVSPEVIKSSLEILSTNKVLLESNDNGRGKDGIIRFIEHVQELLSS
jgi:HEAT repeat protein